MQSTHRAHFLDELVNVIPKQRAHFGKRLVGIDGNSSTGDRVTLRFKDGHSTTADAVVGADGIRKQNSYLSYQSRILPASIF